MPTKKKSSTPVRLSQYNRVQATIRKPQYLKDYNYVESLKSRLKKVVPFEDIPRKIGVKTGDRISMDKLDKETKAVLRYHFEAQKVKRKWQLNWLLNPQEVMQWEKGEMYGFICPDVVDVIPDKIGKIEKGVVRYPEDFIPYLKDGRYLTLQIDLTGRKGEILKIVEEKIDFFGKLVMKPLNRERETTLIPWHVYDMHKKEGKSLLKIAKEIYGFKKNPAYDPQSNAKYKQVKAAYAKAKKMIAQINPAR